MTMRAVFRERAWMLFLGLEAAGIAILVVLPIGTAWTVLYLALNASAAAAVAVAIRLNRPVPSAPWQLALAGLVVYSGANAIYFPAFAGLTASLPFPSAADALYLAAYGLLIVAGARLAVARGAFRRVGDVVDALVVAGGLAILAFEALIAPYLDPALDIEIAARLVAAAYPLVDVGLLGIAAWIVFAGIGRTVAATLLGAYLVAQLGADWIYGLDVLAGTLDKARPEFVLWPAGLALLGAAALHPSMADLTSSNRSAPSVQRRVLVLGAAAVAGPIVTTLAALDPGFDTAPLAALSALVVGLVAVRVGLLAGDVRTHRRELGQLQATRARIEALLETSGAIIWSGRVLPGPDAETVTEFASRQMLGVTGYAADDLISGRVRWVDRIHPDDSSRILDQFRAWIHAESDDGRAEDALGYRYRFIRRDGEVRWLRDTVKVSERDGGIPTRVTGVILDVTAEAEADEQFREANRRLRASEQRYQDLIDNMAAVTWSAELVPGADADIRRTFMSPQVEDLTGHAAAAFLGGTLRWREVIHPDDRSAVLERLAQGRRRASEATAPDDAVDRFSCEYRIVASNGDVRWVRDTERIVRGADGLATGIQGLLVDITERRERESRVQAFNQELEVLVARRVAELTEARTEAERANRAKSEFLSSMSHELRTPLNAILGFGQLLEMAPLPPAERESATEILRAGRNLLAMIEGVLEFSRLDAGRVTLSIEPVDLGSLVRETVDLARPAAEGHQVTIDDLVSRDDPPVVLADRRRLAQVLLNLLSNASKFNRVGGTVTLTAHRTNGRARILVADTGVGIEPERLAHIFEPLDARPGELASRRSVGLGLALSSRLVALMDGALSVTSEHGIGSTFTVELPIAATAEPRDPSTLETRADRAGVRPARATILYIEDNLANLQLVERVLATRNGVRMLAAMQGRLGLELACEHRPDLIFLDLDLPDVEPEETLRELRSDRRTRDIPVIVLSSDSSASLARRMVELGALDFVAKPFDMPRLLALVDGVLGKP